MAMPVFKAAGSAFASLNSAGIGWPIGHAAGDFGLFFIETCGGEPVPATPSGWTPVANSPQATGAGTAGTQLTVFYKIATSSSEPSAPTGDSGDHNHGVIVTFTGVANIGVPWDVTAGGVKATAAANASLPTLTTTVADTLIVQAITHDLDIGTPAFTSVTNAALASLTERHDQSSGQGNGGGIAVFTGQKAVAGSIGTTTVNVASCVNAMLTIALRGPLLVPNVVGLAEATASSTITGAGFTVGTITYSSSPSVAAGLVISQSPTAGTEAAGGAAVDFVVSTGPATIAVPDVVGEAEADAITAITGAGLTVGTITTAPSASVAAGHVISQSPTAGTLVTPGSAVNLVIAVTAGLVVTIDGIPQRILHDSLSIQATVNGRDRFSATLPLPTAAPDVRHEIVATFDGVRIFGGLIDTVQERAASSLTDVPSQLYAVTAVDFNGVADWRYIDGVSGVAQTLKEVLEGLIPFLADVTLDPAQAVGPVLPQRTYFIVPVTQVLDELATITGWVWNIDYFRVLSMWDPDTVAAPFDLLDSTDHAIGDITVEPIATEFATTVLLLAGDTSQREVIDTFTGDGTTTDFPLHYPLIAHGGSLTVNGVPEAIGPGEVWDLAEVPAPHHPTYTLVRTSAPAAAAAIAFPYTAQFPMLIRVEDLDLVTELGGFIEHLVREPGIFHYDEALAVAEGYLAQVTTPRREVRYRTLTPGLVPGQTQTITIANRSLDGSFLITDVETRMQDPLLVYGVTAHEGPLFHGMADWRETYKQWALVAGATAGAPGSTDPVGGGGGGGAPAAHHLTHEPGGSDVLMDVAWTDAANTFTADQTIDGDLLVTGTITPLTDAQRAAINALIGDPTGARMLMSSSFVSGLSLRHDESVERGRIACGNYDTQTYQPLAFEVEALEVHTGISPAARVEHVRVHPLGGVTVGAGPDHATDPGLGILRARGLDGTPLDATQLTTGTVPEARLPTTVARRDQGNTFTQPQTVSYAAPLLSLVDTSQPANSRVFRIANYAQILTFEAFNDDMTVSQGSSYFNRAGDFHVSRNLLEKGRTTPIGHVIDVGYSAAHYSVYPSGAWTVAAGQLTTFCYSLVGKTAVVSVVIDGSTVSGSPILLIVANPLGGPARHASAVARINLGGAWEEGSINVQPADGSIYVSRRSQAAWVSPTSLQFTLTFFIP
jgi:hypothetical protein